LPLLLWIAAYLQSIVIAYHGPVNATVTEYLNPLDIKVARFCTFIFKSFWK